jgi:signal transduction histidine kinase
VSWLQEPALDDLELFAAAVAHELRTPLAALSGEVDVALRRDRSAPAYRDALVRILAAVNELVELTGDLTFIGQPSDAGILPTKKARLDEILARVVERYASNADMAFAVDPMTNTVVVAGDEALLTRALTLVVDHAVKHRRGGAQLRLRAALVDDASTAFGRVDLVVEAPADAFWPQTWLCLVAPAEEGDGAAQLHARPLRLQTADRIVSRCGGSLRSASADGAGGVHILLRCAEPA